jgi:DNA primase
MAVIVEGYMDVITAHQNGFHNVVAAMGTSLTDKQVRLIKRLSKNVLLALDADAAGEEAMKRCITLENVLGTEIKIVKIPAGKDPDDVIKESPAEWLNLVERAVPLLDFIFGIVASNLDLSKARDKSLAVERLLPVLTGMADKVRQGYYVQKLATKP